MPLTVEPVDPRALDDETADGLAAILNTMAQADTPRPLLRTGAGVAAEARYSTENRPYDGLWVARSGGETIGHASLEFSTWSNTHLGVVFCAVHPEHRGRGAGRRLLDVQIEAVRAAGRSMLLTFALRETPTAQFLLTNGFDVGQHNTQRRIAPQKLDYRVTEALAAEAATAAADYELVRLVGPLPKEWLPDLQSLAEAINDAPLDGADLEAESLPVERLRAYDLALAARGQRVYRLLARHRATGEWAGHTILCVDELRPGVALQEDTSVLSAHRGHRLGLLLKATMLLWMRESHPELTSIDTWNADTNAHMIAVNEQLGAFVLNRGYLLQRHV